MGIFYVMPAYEESFFNEYDERKFLGECCKVIGCDLVEMHLMRADIAMWVDEEATITGQPKNIPATLAMSSARGYLHPVYGTAVFTGYRKNKETHLPVDFHSLVADCLIVRLR